VDSSNIVMDVKALKFPGISVEDVLSGAIEAPAVERVAAAMKGLGMFRILGEQKTWLRLRTP